MQSQQDPQTLKSDVRVTVDFGEVEGKRLRQMENEAGLEQVTWGDWSSPWRRLIQNVRVIDGQVTYTCKVQGDSDWWVFYGNDAACGLDHVKDVRVAHGRLLVIGAKYHYPTGHPRFESVWLTWGDYMKSGFRVADLEVQNDRIRFRIQGAQEVWEWVDALVSQAGRPHSTPP